MKKILCTIVVLVILLCVIGCGNNNAADDLRRATERMNEAMDNYETVLEETTAAQALIDEYRELTSRLEELSEPSTYEEEQERVRINIRLIEIRQELRDRFPDMKFE